MVTSTNSLGIAAVQTVHSAKESKDEKPYVKKPLLLHCFSFIVFHWPVIKKILIAGRKCYSCNPQVSVFTDVWRLHAAIPCACVKIKFQFPICGNWKRSKWMQAHIQSSLEAFSLFLVFSVQTKPKTPLHLIVSHIEQKKHFNAEIRLPYSNWFDHLSFMPFKLFISSWSLWSNSIHPDKSSRVKNSKACRRTKYGNWIQSQVGIKYKCWKSKAGYFC